MREPSHKVATAKVRTGEPAEEILVEGNLRHHLLLNNLIYFAFTFAPIELLWNEICSYLNETNFQKLWTRFIELGRVVGQKVRIYHILILVVSQIHTTIDCTFEQYIA